MKRLFIICLLIITNCVQAQDYASVDSKTDTYPSRFVGTDGLAALINKDFVKPEEKARAVFRWVTTHVAYDLVLEAKVGNSPVVFSYKTEKEKNEKERKFLDELAEKTIESKMAICHGYSALIEVLLMKCGLETKTILGTLKSSPEQIGELPGEVNHAWNAVKINNKWQFIDATIAAGYISTRTDKFEFRFNDSYFLMNPDLFFANHYPSDEKWLLTNKTKSDFAAQPLFFGDYFLNGYKLITPVLGKVSGEQDTFTFHVSGVGEGDTIQYVLSNENKFNYTGQDDNTIQVTVSLKGMKDGYISIFVNTRIIVIFKIQS